MASGTSRDFAKNLRALAEWLDARPEFPMPSVTARTPYNEYYDKDEFIQAVRALGAGKKEDGILGKDYLKFIAETTPEDTEVQIEINRVKVCKLVRPAQPAEYDCESLLNQAEEAEIGK